MTFVFQGEIQQETDHIAHHDPSNRGKIRPNHVVDEFKKILRRAGLPAIRFHDLRHNTATLLLSLGVHAKVVQEMLGKTDLRMTMDIYSHVLPSMQVDAVLRLNDLLQEGASSDEVEL